MRMAMGLQKSPASSKRETPPKPPAPPPPNPSPTNKAPPKAVFSRSFGVYFPRSSAQVQPRPPDVTELLRVVEDLRERESLLKTELLGHKLLKESVAIVPVLESEISSKNAEIDRASKRVDALEIENQKLRMELEELRTKIEYEREESEKKLKAMESEISELKKTASDRSSSSSILIESEELSSSQRFQGLMEVTVKSNLIKNLKKQHGAVSNFENNHQKLEVQDSKKDEADQHERPRHSRCNSEELAESTLSSLRSRPPRVPKPPPRPSASSSSSSSSCSSNGSCGLMTEQANIPLPPPPPPPPKMAAPPPPPPPPLKGMKIGAAKVRRVPEVVEFYHSLMRRESRRDSAASDVAPATANARDMIGEIENRSAHLLAVRVPGNRLLLLIILFMGCNYGFDTD